MKKLRIFIASPSDVSEERDIVSSVVVPEIQRIFSDNQLLGKKGSLTLEAIRWETHAWPDVGDDAQDVINKEIGDYDLLVGIMWKRFGTPTKRSSSGTGEEFERAYEYFKTYQRPKIMFYFRTAPFYTTTRSEITQFQKVVRFRGKLEKLGVLFWEYSSPLQFERDVREHLIRQIRQYIKPTKTLPTRTVKKGAKTRRRSTKTYTQSLTTGITRIFLAYARQDLSIVKPIYYMLKDAGYQPWLDVETLLPGQDWLSEIQRAILSSDVFLIFLSSKSTTTVGYVQKEIRIALEKVDEMPPGEIFMIPVRLDPVEPPERLRSYQWIDYFAEGGPERLMLAIKTVAKHRRRSTSK